MSLARCRSKILNTATDLRKPTIDHSLTRVEDCWEQGKYTYIRTIHTYKRRRILQQRIDEQLDGLLEKAR